MKITNDNNGRIEIYTPYNEGFVKDLKRSIGGRKWDMDKNCWTAPEEALDSVRELMLKHFGETDISDTPKVKVALDFSEDVKSEDMCVTIFGKTVARAYSSCSVASLPSDVVYRAGKCRAAGSRKYPFVMVEAGSIIVLSNVPKPIIETETLPEGVTYTIMRQEQSEASLKNERERLLERIAKIDEELKRLASC